MRRIITILSVFSFFFMMAGAQSEAGTSRKITVDEAVLLTADNNISLRRQRINVDLLEQRSTSSWNSVSPSASLSGSLTKPFGENSSGFSYSFGATISLSFTPSLFTSIKDAKLRFESGKTSYEDALRQIELNVRKLFYSLLYAKESIALQNRNMETARIRYENNRDKYERGQLSELDLFQSQYAYESMRPSIEAAEISYQNNIASFKQMLGIPQREGIELEGSLTDAIPPESFSVDKSLEDIPSVKRIMDSIEQQKNSLLATRFSAYGPSLSASYSYGKSGNSKVSDLQTQNSLSLSMRIPLDGYLPWSNGALSILNQKATLEDLELQLEDELTNAELSLANSVKNIILQQSQMELMDRNVEMAQRSYDMTLAAYNYGSRDLLTLQNAADSLMKARLDRASHIYNLICAVLDLENMLGIPFGSLGNE